MHSKWLTPVDPCGLAVGPGMDSNHAEPLGPWQSQPVVEKMVPVPIQTGKPQFEHVNILLEMG